MTDTLWLVIFSGAVPFGTLVYVLMTVPKMQAKLDDMNRGANPPVVNVYVLPTKALCWMCATMMLGWGLTLVASPTSLESFPAYSGLLVRFNQGVWAGVCLVVALARMFALIMNGRMRLASPMIRLGTSFVGALVWSQFVYSFVGYSIVTGSLSPGVTVYVVLMGADLYSCGKSMYDWVVAR